MTKEERIAAVEAAWTIADRGLLWFGPGRWPKGSRVIVHAWPTKGVVGDGRALCGADGFTIGLPLMREDSFDHPVRCERCLMVPP